MMRHEKINKKKPVQMMSRDECMSVICRYYSEFLIIFFFLYRIDSVAVVVVFEQKK